MNKLALLITAGLAVTLLSGCAATRSLIMNSDLEVNTKMAESIFLDPAAPGDKTVFIQFRNTTDKSGFKPKAELAAKLRKKGYRSVSNPDAAHYWIQINVRKAGEVELSSVQKMMQAGYGGGAAQTAGSAVSAAGAVAAMNNGGNVGAAAGVGLAAGAAEFVSSAMVENVTLSAITDIQIAEKASGQVTTNRRSSLSQGTQSRTTQRSRGTSDRMKYRTRTLTTASSVNLDWQEARKAMATSLANSLSGLL